MMQQSLKTCISHVLRHAEGCALAAQLLATHGHGLLPPGGQASRAWPVQSGAALKGSGAFAPPGRPAAFHTSSGVLADDYYTVLGVAKTASDQDIKKAFYKLAKQYHPDTNKDNPAAAKRFQDVNRAYQTLRDPEKRSLYDRVGREAMERMEAEGGGGGGAPGGGGGWSEGSAGFNAQDIFEMFARAGGGGGRGGFGMFMNSFMMEQTVQISLEEAISGVKRSVKVQVNPYGPPLTVPITIPPGVDSGMGLQEQVGLGQVSLLLTVRIEVLPHRTFRRAGDDLHVNVDVGLVDALLGGHVDVPTLAGVRPVAVPACSMNEDVLVIPGFGVPRLSGGGRGNLKVHLRVKKPKGGLTERQRHLLVEFEREEAVKSRPRAASSGAPTPGSSSSGGGGGGPSSSSSSGGGGDGPSHAREAPFAGGSARRTATAQTTQQQQQQDGGAPSSAGSSSSSGQGSPASDPGHTTTTTTTTSSSSTSSSGEPSGGGAGGSWFDTAKTWFTTGAGGSSTPSSGSGDSSSSSSEQPGGQSSKRRTRKSGGG